jgi:16S rRNA (uracil1498-N3)-methyltransferase
MQLFFHSGITASTETFSFDKEESRHIVRVLRKKEGDSLAVTNGRGDLLQTEIILAGDKCTVRKISASHRPKRDYALHLAVAPTKMNDRYEWFLEKATEFGFDSVTPLICEHSERKAVKTERFEKVILSAMKQSLQSWLPECRGPESFKSFVSRAQQGKTLIAHCADGMRTDLKSAIAKGDSVTVLIGPEGDFSPAEIAMALDNGYIPVSLGHTRLRTETAALAACHGVVFLND